ncbi:uncharacterized protein EAE98_006438 [Botrytis deweyae]|uniref:FAD-binding domain-containing protein n=1 Tax=Botrytis deweyae TaxID=2478750 RepID=A0ABQ7IJC0_9HELO|nr:uncharacterized protein EAE98_006438 [Botrytis deweyae]KAF7926143.1 hypothetical protein EAE98_006438 [Botrytis deweyae]
MGARLQRFISTTTSPTSFKRSPAASPVTISIYDPHSVTAFFEDGTSVTASAHVGADGIRSEVRQTWNQEKTIFSGQIVMQGLIKMAALPQEVQNYCKHVTYGSHQGKRTS